MVDALHKQIKIVYNCWIGEVLWRRWIFSMFWMTLQYQVQVKLKLTGPHMMTQSSCVFRKLLGSNGCQNVKITGVLSVHSKFICMAVSCSPIHNSSTSDNPRKMHLYTSAIWKWLFALVCVYVFAPLFMCILINSSSGSVWMLTKWASIFWQFFSAWIQFCLSELSL